LSVSPIVNVDLLDAGHHVGWLKSGGVLDTECSQELEKEQVSDDIRIHTFKLCFDVQKWDRGQNVSDGVVIEDSPNGNRSQFVNLFKIFRVLICGHKGQNDLNQK
jgi:hypothetical protein